MSLPSASAPLSDLGWSDRWSALLADLTDDVPEHESHPPRRAGRVIRRDRGFALVATGDETVPVPTNGLDLVTGDWVALDGDGRVTLLPRHGVLRRRGPDGAEQLMAANVDVLLLVCGLDRPVRPGRIHRGVVQAWDAGAAALVVLTKCDLAGGPDDPNSSGGGAHPDAITAGLLREAPGIDVIPTSSHTGEGLDQVRSALAGRTAALVGESGAGKSTLLNVLAGLDLAETGTVRAGDFKGRHTTTRRELHVIPGLGQIIDTPGLRSFGLAAEPSAVDAAFADIEALAVSCRFRDCRHSGEPGCAVEAAAGEGTLSDHRLDQYRRLQRELASEILRSTPHQYRQARRRFGRISREAQRLKGRDD